MTIRRVAGWASVGCLVILAATGLWLLTNYRPSGYSFFRNEPLRPSYPQRLHAVTSIGFVFFALVYVIALVRTRVDGRRIAVVGGYALVSSGILGFFSGLKLPWDQLALNAVTVGRKYGGVLDAAFHEHIRFVIVAGTQVSQPAYRANLIGHVVAVPLVALAGWLALRSRLDPFGEGIGEQGGDAAGVHKHDRPVGR